MEAAIISVLSTQHFFIYLSRANPPGTPPFLEGVGGIFKFDSAELVAGCGSAVRFILLKFHISWFKIERAG